jgi:membrane peptidoglycan carboxypeptidase
MISRLTMRFPSEILSWIALIFLRQEWFLLRNKLLKLYNTHRLDSNNRPSWLVQALLISAEDHRFFYHAGIDFVAVCRAVYRNILLGRKEGASTIEMQLVRVLTGRYERTLSRKLREAALATLLTTVVPKSDLPALYIQAAYYGWRMNGFMAACRRMNLDPSVMTLWQAASLIARLKYPEPRYAPATRMQQINVRCGYILYLHKQHINRHAYAGLRGKVVYAPI